MERERNVAVAAVLLLIALMVLVWLVHACPNLLKSQSFKRFESPAVRLEEAPVRDSLFD